MKSNWINCMVLSGAVIALSACDQNSDSTGASDPTATQNRSGGASTLPDTNSATSVAPDNTGRNVRDRSEGALTSEDQGGSEQDRELTRRIRRALTENDQLSTAAKNIKIITRDGKVTLRGPVNSSQEQQSINSIIQQLGISGVDNQLEVKATNQ